MLCQEMGTRSGTEPSLVIPRKHFQNAAVGVLFPFQFCCGLILNFFFSLRNLLFMHQTEEYSICSGLNVTMTFHFSSSEGSASF